jgi:hypothetical protein
MPAWAIARATGECAISGLLRRCLPPRRITAWLKRPAHLSNGPCRMSMSVTTCRGERQAAALGGFRLGAAILGRQR